MTIGAAAIGTLLVERGFWTVAVLLAGVSLALAVCAATGWLGGSRTLSSAVWTSEGTWWLTDRRGEVLHARLLADSRVFGHWLWLRWDSAKGRRQAFLLRRPVQSEAVRRLAVRLRLEGAALRAHPDDSLL